MDQWLGHMLGNVQRWGDYRGAVPVAFTGLRCLLSVKSAVVIVERGRKIAVWVGQRRRRLLDVQMW